MKAFARFLRDDALSSLAQPRWFVRGLALESAHSDEVGEQYFPRSSNLFGTSPSIAQWPESQWILELASW